MSEYRPFPYKRREAPPPVDDSGAAQDRHFAKRMLLFAGVIFAIVFWTIARVVARRANPDYAAYAAAEGLLWILGAIFLLTWLTKDSFLRRHLKEDVRLAIQVILAWTLISIFVSLAWFTLR